jgi:hypothetical protein
MDQALEVLALRERTSKAALIRKFVAERISRPMGQDPLDALVGIYDEEPGDIDALVYGP